jgi:hypothetical protein
MSFRKALVEVILWLTILQLKNGKLPHWAREELEQAKADLERALSELRRASRQARAESGRTQG